jgi:hypothetical protein
MVNNAYTSSINNSHQVYVIDYDAHVSQLYLRAFYLTDANTLMVQNFIYY